MAQLVTAPAPNARHRSAPVTGPPAAPRRRSAPTARERRSRRPSAVLTRPERTLDQNQTSGLELLDSYVDADGRDREVIAIRRGDSCVLVVDRDRTTLGDRLLVACLAADEPPANAALTCALYIEDPNRGRCRRLCREDLTDVLPSVEEQEVAWPPVGGELAVRAENGEEEAIYSIEPLATRRADSELRWHVRRRAPRPFAPVPVSLRDVVAAIESYEPVYERSLAALAACERDANVSGTTLRQELERLRESPVVLNRGLREAVNAAVQGGLSMGEIAVRCNRIKHSGSGAVSGHTSWLARRIGLLAESGNSRPTPWIHSQVLALIARDGLGVSPREVEL